MGINITPLITGAGIIGIAFGLGSQELVKDIIDWPQFLINVRVAKEKKATWNENKIVTDFIKEKEKEMAGNGRILVRTSGTEPIIRVMTEGKEENLVKRIAEEISELIKKELA